MLTLLLLFAMLVGFFVVAYFDAGGWAWTLTIAMVLALAWGAHLLPSLALLCLGAALVVLAIPLNWPILRRKLVSDGILATFRRVLPPMSQTEREAIEAGSVWWDADLFSGRPDWTKLLNAPLPQLSAEEQRFIDNECEQLCGMISEWGPTNVRELPGILLLPAVGVLVVALVRAAAPQQVPSLGTDGETRRELGPPRDGAHG